MALRIYKKNGLKISRADIPQHQKAYDVLFGMPAGWAPSEKILDFISSVSVNADVTQQDKHTVQSREPTPTGFLYFCFPEATGVFKGIHEKMQK